MAIFRHRCTKGVSRGWKVYWQECILCRQGSVSKRYGGLSINRFGVDVDTFQNDLSILESKDEVLTALIHLGYLGYDADRKSAYIPNYEVASAYQLALKKSGWCTKIVTESINNQINVLKICDN